MCAMLISESCVIFVLPSANVMFANKMFSRVIILTRGANMVPAANRRLLSHPRSTPAKIRQSKSTFGRLIRCANIAASTFLTMMRCTAISKSRTTRVSSVSATEFCINISATTPAWRIITGRSITCANPQIVRALFTTLPSIFRFTIENATRAMLLDLTEEYNSTWQTFIRKVAARQAPGKTLVIMVGHEVAKEVQDEAVVKSRNADDACFTRGM
mmetsp:Transcript_6985/g.12587  ORF Transcript_6985/g.12587 Transcript_6985/m.12587 type:complete len:215 (-) Transcript_6985:669-1313(-)